MKYINKYNHIEMYTSISMTQYYEYFDIRPFRIETSNQKEADIINDILIDKRFYANLRKAYSISYIEISFTIFLYNSETTVITIHKIPDEWYLVYLNGKNIAYKCDQLEGLLSCIKDSIDVLSDSLAPRNSPMHRKNQGRKRSSELHLKPIKEYNSQYYSDSPPELEDFKMISVSRKDINYIKKMLNMNNVADIIKTMHSNKTDIISYYCLYYNTTTGEVGNPNTMNDGPKRLIKIYSFTDEWFEVVIDDSDRYKKNSKDYWCDQVDGVIKCIKDSINKDIYHNYINENHSTESAYTQIDVNELSKYLTNDPDIYGSYLSLKFNEKEFSILKQLDKGDFSFTPQPVLTNSIKFTMSGYNTTQTLGEILKGEDEWYIVELNIMYVPFLYYRCDQLSGLIEFLEFLRKVFIENGTLKVKIHGEPRDVKFKWH